MKKERLYFPHDYNARSDPKLQEVMMDIGCEGIGIYWCIIEQLYEEDGIMSMKAMKSIAFGLHVEYEKVLRLINNFGLFEHDEDSFWSESVNRRILQRNQLLDKRRSASKKANQVRWHGTSETDKDLSQTENVSIPNGEHSEKERTPNGEHEESDSFPIQYNIIKSKENKECVYTRTHEEFFEKFFRKENQQLLDKMCMDFGTDLKTIKNIALQIINEWTLTEQSHKDYNDASRHLISLIQKKIQSEKKVERKTEERQNNAQGSWSFEEENEKHRQRMAAKKNCISHEEYLKLKQGEA